jgi:putative peptidoglycan lipid II flippase
MAAAARRGGLLSGNKTFMIKGFRQIASFTVLSRILGLLREMTFASFFGASGVMDIWVIGFKIPNLARRLFGEGAASSSFIPVYSQKLQEDPKQAQELANTAVTVITVLLTAIVIVGEAFIWIYYGFFATLEGTKQMYALSGIMLPYMILVCVVAILGGVLNTHRHFAAPAAAPLILNIFLLGALWYTEKILHTPGIRQVYYISIAVLLAGLAQLAIQIPALKSVGVTIGAGWQVHSDAFKKIFLLMAPMILGLAATQINTLVDDITAKCLSGSAEKGEFFYLFGTQIKYPLWEGTVARLFYAQRLYQFPLGVLGISLAVAIFPVMSAQVAKKDFSGLSKSISSGLRTSIFIALPATAGLILIGKPLISAIYQRGLFTANDTLITTKILSCFSLGLCGYFAQQLITRAFYSFQDSKMPAISAAIAVGVNLVLNLTLVWFIGAAGLALSTALCSYLQVFFLLIVLQKKLGSSLLDGLPAVALKTIAATIAMTLTGLLALYLLRNLPHRSRFDIIRVIVVVISSASVYILAAKVLKIDELKLLTAKNK